MSTNESSIGRSVVGFLNALVAIAAIAVILLVGLYYLPKIKAGFAQASSQPQATNAPADDAELNAIKAQLAAVKAQLAAAASRTIVQTVPEGQAPQPVAVPAQPAPATDGAPAEQAPASAPIVIVSHEGYQQPVITGSGACAVAKGARRCGK